MNVAIMACPRPSPNALDTIESMVKADPLAAHFNATVVFDGAAPLGTLWSLSPAELQSQVRRTPRRRAIYNYGRCLALCPDLVVEDDVVFASGWTHKLRAAIEATRGEVPILGYNRLGVEGWLPKGEKLWGSLLIWWPGELLGEAMRALLRRVDDESYGGGADEILGEAFDRIWCVSPSLVQHAGEVSIINPTHGARRAPDFQP